MTKALLLLTLLISAFYSWGQSTPKYVYCEILAAEKAFNSKVTITVDFGQYRDYFEDNRMKDQAGNPVAFNSIVDALNFMSREGWEFVQAYWDTVSSGSRCRYLMKKPFDELDEETQRSFLKSKMEDDLKK